MSLKITNSLPKHTAGVLVVNGREGVGVERRIRQSREKEHFDFFVLKDNQKEEEEEEERMLYLKQPSSILCKGVMVFEFQRE